MYCVRPYLKAYSSNRLGTSKPKLTASAWLLCILMGFGVCFYLWGTLLANMLYTMCPPGALKRPKGTRLQLELQTAVHVRNYGRAASALPAKSSPASRTWSCVTSFTFPFNTYHVGGQILVVCKEVSPTMSLWASIGGVWALLSRLPTPTILEWELRWVAVECMLSTARCTQRVLSLLLQHISALTAAGV